MLVLLDNTINPIVMLALINMVNAEFVLVGQDVVTYRLNGSAQTRLISP